MPSIRKSALPWLIGAALAAVGGVITVATPPEDALRAPFLAQGSYEPDGTPPTATTRAVAATLLGASFADRISTEDEQWQAEGNWLVVTISASAPQTEVDSDIELAALRVGGEVFHASERMRDSLLGEHLRIDLETVGMLAFELPDDVRSGEATLELSPSLLTPRLDDLAAFSIRLEELPAASEIEIAPTEVGP